MSKTKSTLTEINKKLKENEDTVKELKKKLKNGTKETIELLKELMKESPEILAVRWHQYTPYFNDGDSCEFGVGELEIKFNPEVVPPNEEDEEEEDEFVQEWRIEKYIERCMDVMNVKEMTEVEKKVEMFQKIHGALANMSDGLLEAFGDHVTVTVTRKGIETESHDHE